MELTRVFEITNKLGLHAKAAGVFVQTTNKYQSDFFVKKDDVEVNGKSIMGLMMLAAAKGSKIMITAKGQDAKEAMTDLYALIKDKFGEDE
jgi:phosphocarrier protein